MFKNIQIITPTITLCHKSTVLWYLILSQTDHAAQYTVYFKYHYMQYTYMKFQIILSS